MIDENKLLKELRSVNIPLIDLEKIIDLINRQPKISNINKRGNKNKR